MAQVGVVINNRRDDLRFLSGSGEILGNEGRIQRRMWGIHLDRSASQSVLVAKAHMSWGTLRIDAAEGVTLQELGTDSARITDYRCVVRPGGSARFKVGGDHGQGTVDVAVVDWRRENPTLVVLLVVALGVIAVALVGLILA